MTTRKTLVLLATTLALGAGCKLSPAKSCTHDSDCDPATGGYCDTEHSVCRVGPGGDGGFQVGIHVPSPGPRGAFLRGDTAQVVVSANESNATFKWTLQGVLADGGTSAATNGTASATSTPCPAGVSAAFCAVIPVDLSVPPLGGMAGSFAITVTGTNSGNASASAASTIPVTRLKWQQQIGHSIVASPAISDSDGTLYVATADVGGELAAVNLDGTVRWTADAGQVIASPAVGASDVYVAGEDKQSSQSFLLDVAHDGSVPHRCPTGTGYGAPFVASLAISTGAGAESAIGFSGQSETFAPLTPSAPSNNCNGETIGAGTDVVSAPGSLVSLGKQAFVGAKSGEVFAYLYSSNWIVDPNWTNGVSAVGTSALSGLSVMATSVVGTIRTYGAWEITSSNGSFTGESPGSGVAGGPGSPAISETGDIFFGSSDGTLRRIQLPTSSNPSSVASGPIIAAPLLGKDATLYTASQTGSLQVWDTNLNLQWSAALNSGTGGFFASPNIDCARYSDGGIYSGPGTLYLAAMDGTVYAIQVDSHGLDATAPWPRYQHDSRSTGNADAGILNCP